MATAGDVDSCSGEGDAMREETHYQQHAGPLYLML
jgi:hypothetical protein